MLCKISVFSTNYILFVFSDYKEPWLFRTFVELLELL